MSEEVARHGEGLRDSRTQVCGHIFLPIVYLVIEENAYVHSAFENVIFFLQLFNLL